MDNKYNIIDDLQKQNELLSQQLTFKDKKIELLQEQNTALLAALKAAQALYVGTIHQQAIEAKAEEPAGKN